MKILWVGKYRMSSLFKAAASVLISLVLVHGLVVSSLLVECVRADGSCQLRLVGHHPCPYPVGAYESCNHGDESAFLFWTGASARPCVDLSMDAHGIAQESSNWTLLSFPGKFARCCSSHDSILPVIPPVFRVSFKLAREPVISCGCRDLSSTLLRI